MCTAAKKKGEHIGTGTKKGLGQGVGRGWGRTGGGAHFGPPTPRLLGATTVWAPVLGVQNFLGWIGAGAHFLGPHKSLKALMFPLQFAIPGLLEGL